MRGAGYAVGTEHCEGVTLEVEDRCGFVEKGAEMEMVVGLKETVERCC